MTPFTESVVEEAALVRLNFQAPNAEQIAWRCT